MSYLYDLPNSTGTGDQILAQTVSTVPALSPLILFLVFAVVAVGGIVRQKIRTGTADYSAWCVIGSMATMLVSLVLSVSAGYVRLDWLIIVISLVLLSGVWFFFDRKISEV